MNKLATAKIKRSVFDKQGPQNTNLMPWPYKDGYRELVGVLHSAYMQAAFGKGDERHANNLAFKDQRMQTISDLLNTDNGMAFQAIKKLTEGLQFTDPQRRENELLGAIVYISGIIVRHRQAQNIEPVKV